MCQHLEAVSRGDILNLIINVPPGSTKSLTVNVFWPAWVWINHPGMRWLCASNEGDLVIRDAVACRRLIESEWYRERWGEVFKLTSDQNVKGWYENSRRGFRTSTTVGSSVTGKKGDILVVDDPDDARKVDSEAERKRVHEWWDKAFYNRVNDYKTGRRVIIGQRTHHDDLIGHVLKTGGFEQLVIPEEFEPERRVTTSIGWTDWRTELGELLRPERFGEQQKVEAIKRLGSLGYAGQHQQRPVPRDGAMFRREWFGAFVDAAPIVADRVRYWDKAGTDGGGDYTAGVLMAKTPNGLYYVEDVVRGQWSSGARNTIIRQTAEKDARKYGVGGVHIWLEREGGSGGKESGEISVRELAGYLVSVDLITGSKEVRANPLAIQCEAGNVRLVRGDWNESFVDELASFPHGRHDDQVDGASGAFNKLALMVYDEIEDDEPWTVYRT